MRLIPAPAGSGIVFHFAQNIVELPGCYVALHLLIPLIIFPTMQPRREFGALFERELLDDSLNLG